MLLFVYRKDDRFYLIIWAVDVGKPKPALR
jgi:hypothetical protein